MKSLRLILAATLIASLAFAWGFFAHREKTFPFYQLRELAWRTGWLEKPSRQAMVSPSPAVDLLAALPYVDATFDPDRDRRGVVVHDRQRAYPGLNLYPSAVESEAYLVDMNGARVHRWSAPPGPWQHVELLPGGELLVMVEDRKLMKLDLRSRLLWSLDLGAHHDFDVDDEGALWVLAQETRLVPRHHPTMPILEDFVVRVSADGREQDRLSVLALLESSPYAFLLPSFADLAVPPTTHSLDPIHTNHVEVFDGRLASRGPIYRRGNLLLSMRQLNTIAIVDPARREIVWIWGPSNLTFQHQPTLLDNGHLLIFDNGTQRSQVLEIDPLDYRVVWRYAPEEGFFTAGWGSAQRLANGNTLITESQAGRVIEVTPQGEVVWRFENPAFTDRGKRVAIWRMVRHPLSDLDFLDSVAR